MITQEKHDDYFTSIRIPSANGLNRNFAHRLKIEYHQMLLENGLPGDRFNDSRDIVADETELGAPSRLLHGPPQRRLGVLSH